MANYTYLALVPENIRPGNTLSVPVHFAKPVNGETVNVKLIETTFLPDGKETTTVHAEATETVTRGASSVTVNLQVPAKIDWGSYKVNVTGDGPVKFEGSVNVYGRRKAFAIFIQTDKAMYKPGETVKYRIFVVNGNLKSVDPLLDIEFFDPKGNKIDERMGVQNLTGVEGSLPLSDMPPLGRWRISVNAKEFKESQDYTFEVKEYVLPKFEITVTLPSFGKTTDTSLTGSVKAAYTFGKPVKGNIALTISRRYDGGFFDIKALSTEMPIDGTATFDIPMTVLKRLTRNIDYETFLVRANVTEAITGITLEGEGEIRYHSNPYRVEFFPNMPDNFKPGFNPYKVWVKVIQQDERPPENVTDEMKVTITYFTDKPVAGSLPNTITIPNYEVVSPFIDGDVIMKETVPYPLGVDGTVQFGIQIPDNTATATIEADFKGTKVYKEIRRFRSPSDTFLKSEMLNNVEKEPLKIGDIASIKVTNTGGPVTANYVVLAKGQLVTSGEVVISGQFNEGIVQVRVSREMAPVSRFVAYYVKDDGEIVADGLNFVIEDIFENKVTIEFAQPSPQEPKASIGLKVKADKDSLVNILAVDKSVILLAEGNDITPDRVKNEMNQFGDNPWILRGWGPVMPWSFPADDAHDVFDNANLRVLTDGTLHRFDLWSLRQTNFRGKAVAFSAEGGAMMMDSRVGGAGDAPVGQIRKDFPETWIWKSGIAGDNGEVTFTDVVPDTITEFVANAFALNTQTGLGVAPSTANLTVFLPFFLNLQLPYSIVRGETAVIQANVFNYLDQDYKVTVRLEGSDDFVGITVDENGVETEVTGNMTACVNVPKDQPTPVFFNIRPLKIKTLMLNVRAEIAPPTNRFDEVIKTLPVKAEGVEEEKNTPILISFTTQNSVVETRPITYPAELVPDSERIRVTVIGDVFGPSFKNLDMLIRLPYGCGEQNMITFAPSVFAATYMRKTGRFDSNQELMDKIRNVLRTGYQRQLLFQRNDGGFSAFGNADDEGSLWLTTFVVKSLAQAAGLDIIFLDPNVVEKSVNFILDKQNPDGTLNNVGIVSHKALQGGTAASNRSIMAYTLIALQEVKRAEILQNNDTIKRLDDGIKLLTDAVVLSIPQMTTNYERALGSYALILLNNPQYMTLFDLLEKSATTDGSKVYWKNNDSRALEIETTAYALLTYSVKGDKQKGLNVLRWLVDSRNPYGGYFSTQDTVVALQAFSEFAAQIYSKDVDMTLDISTTKGNNLVGTKKQIKLTSENHDILQYVDFPESGDEIKVEAKGIGLAAIDINQFYNIKGVVGPPTYELNLTTSDETNNKYTLRVCAKYNIPNSRSNMAIMDIGVVSGFEPLKDQVVQTPLMKRLELSAGRLIIYFDEIPAEEVCVDVPVQRVSLVAGVKPANVIVYSYYEPTERAMKSYLPTKLETASLCDTCGADCCTKDSVLQASGC